MLNKHTLLTGKGVLAALIGCLVSGQTLADIAGRVTFVVGQVNVIAANGEKRIVGKGELLNSGERLETGNGRLQIRFTDGSLLSLQPNTVLGLDNYTFSRNNPQDGSLLFNFVRGGMRTISGAIGKVNRANYAVKTPAGTIGIRGTAYTATQEPNGRLLVTVNKGTVNLANEFGNRNIPTGQTFQMESNKAPQPAPAGVMAEVLASQPQAVEQLVEKRETKLKNASSFSRLIPPYIPPIRPFPPDPIVPNSANSPFEFTPFFIQSVNGVPRTSHFASLLKGTGESYVHENVLGAFDNVSTDGLQVGNLVGLINTPSADNGLANNALLLDTRHPQTPVQIINQKQVRSLSFGEWTNGSMAFVDNFIYDQSNNFSNRTFIPYVIGTASRVDLGNNQQITYRLADPSHATPVRGGQNAGQLTKLNLSLDLNVQPLASLDMALTVDGVNYTVNAKDRFLTLSDQLSIGSFSLNGLTDDVFAVANNNSCNNQSCPVNFSAFFSANDVGALYEIIRKNNKSLSGAAILTGGLATQIESDIATNQRVVSSLNNDYTLLLSNNAGINSEPNPFSDLSAVFNSQTGGLQLAFAYDATNDRINSFGSTPVNQNGTVISAAPLSQIQHLDQSLTWGVWNNGGIDLNNDSQDFVLSGKQQVHYILGVPSAIPTGNRLTVDRVLYSFVGGTKPTIDSVNNNAQLTGQVANSSYLDFDFGANTVGLNLDINISGSSNSLLNATGKTTLQQNNNIGTFNFANLNIKLGNGNACNSLGCTGSASGFLAGTNGTLAALNYNLLGINDELSVFVQGVAAFKQDLNATAPNVRLDNSNQAIYSALLSRQLDNNPETDITLVRTGNISANFDNSTGAWSSGKFVDGQAEYKILAPKDNDNKENFIAVSTDVQHAKKTLTWGRWVNSDAATIANQTIKLGNNDTVHYLIGIPTAQLPSSGIATYLHAGSTTPTGTIVTPTTVGSPANTISPLTGFSVMNNSKMTVNFASINNDAIKLDMNFNGGAQGNINFQGQSALQTQFTLNNLTVNQQSCQTCAATGFFAGQDANMIGVNYNVKAQLGNSTANMTGVAAFEK